jgi:hypothetical protein
MFRQLVIIEWKSCGPMNLFFLFYNKLLLEILDHCLETHLRVENFHDVIVVQAAALDARVFVTDME